MVLARALFKLIFDGTAIEKLQTIFAALIATMLVMSEIDLMILIGNDLQLKTQIIKIKSDQCWGDRVLRLLAHNAIPSGD